jgi:hypothetical protein
VNSVSPQLRTDRGATPIAHDALDFASLLAIQLERTPWFALSMLAHAVALLALWLLLPSEPPTEDEHYVAFLAAPESAMLPLEVPPEVLPLIEPPSPTEVLDPVEMLVDATDPTNDAADTTLAVDNRTSERQSAFEHHVASNTPVGIGGNPAGPGPGEGRRARRRGGSVPSTQIQRALEWLVAHQDDDGHWDCDGFMKHDVAGDPCTGPGNGVHDVGVTGLALLALLGDGSTLRSGPHREPVKKGVQWLLAQQEDGGRLGSAVANDSVYDHAIATYALAEACGLSESTILRKPLERALGHLAAHRNPYGAWRYQPRDGDSDTSVTGWCVLALGSAKSFGVPVDENALKAALAHFDSCTDAAGRTGYTKAGERSARRPGDHAVRFPPERGEAMTAVSLFCRYFLGQNREEHPTMKQQEALLVANPPVWDLKAGTIDAYYWYYGSYAMFQAGGKAWAEWQKHLGTAVLATQRTDGNARGSWDPACAWGEDGGRVYATAILCLTLQVYYRYGKLAR